MAAGLTVAIVAGLVIGRLGLERYVEDYVWKIRAGAAIGEVRPTLEERVREAWRSTVDIVRRVLPFVVAGIAVGALIHGYVPTELVVAVGGRDNPLAVPALVAARRPALQQRGRDDPHRRGAPRQGPAAGLRARLHDGRHRPVRARAGDPPPGHEATPHRHLRRRRRDRDPRSSATASTCSSPEGDRHAPHRGPRLRLPEMPVRREDRPRGRRRGRASRRRSGT